MAVVSPLVFTLCDGVNVREGLMNILSSGINRMGRESYPSVFGCFIAIQLQFEEYGDEPVEVTIAVTDRDGGPVDVPSFSDDISEMLPAAREVPYVLPLILDSRELPLPEAGIYRVSLSVDGAECAHILLAAE